jgi:hypothetical protein
VSHVIALPLIAVLLIALAVIHDKRDRDIFGRRP